MEENNKIANWNEDPKIPWPLKKATQDEFSYACEINNGMIVKFSKAEINGEWVTLSETNGTIDLTYSPKICSFDATSPLMSFPRGIVVKISDIVWVADAPFGS